jgi:hypothetical protein
MAREFGSGWLVDCKFGTIGAASDKEGGFNLAKAKLDRWNEEIFNDEAYEYHIEVKDDSENCIVVTGFYENKDDEDDSQIIRIYVTKKDNIII